MERMERVNATDLVVNYVKTAMQSGELKVGDKLPKESDIAQELGVGRSSLREGIKILNAYGVVESRQGEGTFIVDNRAKNFFEFLGFLPNKENMKRFLELRRVLEVGNIIFVCGKLKEKDFEELERLVAVLNQECSVEEYVAADKAFHSYLINFSGNPMITQVNNMITAMRGELLNSLFMHQKVIDEARDAHGKILTALKEQDVEKCIQMVVHHIDTTYDFTETIYI